jgi:DNA-binding PadR family transcriptional regulator
VPAAAQSDALALTLRGGSFPVLARISAWDDVDLGLDNLSSSDCNACSTGSNHSFDGIYRWTYYAVMREPTFLILTALAAQPLHGYGIIQSVARLSDDDVILRPGTLYGALDRLVDTDLIATDREEVVDGRLRRYYRLSEAGAQALAAQAERFRQRAAVAEAQLRLRQAPA